MRRSIPTRVSERTREDPDAGARARGIGVFAPYRSDTRVGKEVTRIPASPIRSRFPVNFPTQSRNLPCEAAARA